MKNTELNKMSIEELEALQSEIAGVLASKQAGSLKKATKLDVGDKLISTSGKRLTVQITGTVVEGENTYWKATMLDKELNLSKKNRVLRDLKGWKKASDKELTKVREEIEASRRGKKAEGDKAAKPAKAAKADAKPAAKAAPVKGDAKPAAAPKKPAPRK